MKINRGNRDVQENNVNVNQDGTKEMEKENVVTQQPFEAPTLEEIETEAKASPVSASAPAPVEKKSTQAAQKVDPVVKIQKARELIEAKRARNEKLREIEREKNKLMKKSVGSAPTRLKGLEEDGLPREKTLEEIRNEMEAEAALQGTLTIKLRHQKRQNIASFYKPIPEDVIIETEEGINIAVVPELSYNEVMDMMEWTIQMAVNGRAFISYPVLNIIEDLAIIKFYTDLRVDERDLLNTFDILKRANIINRVKEIIKKEQLDWFIENTEKSVYAYIKYQNSAAGMLEQIAAIGSREGNYFDKIIQTMKDNKDLINKFENVIKEYDEMKKQNNK